MPARKSISAGGLCVIMLSCHAAYYTVCHGLSYYCYYGKVSSTAVKPI